LKKKHPWTNRKGALADNCPLWKRGLPTYTRGVWGLRARAFYP